MEQHFEPDEDLSEAVVVLAAREAWPLYKAIGAYLCQNRRPIRKTRRVAFYAKRTVYPAYPLLLERHDDVGLDSKSISKMLLHPDPVQQRLGRVAQAAVDYGWEPELRTVFLLTGQEDARTVRRSEIPHDGPVGWAMSQRYTTLGALLQAETTADL